MAITTCATERIIDGDFISAVPKAAVGMLVKHIAKEYARHGIRANTVGPGIIETRGMGQRILSETADAAIDTLKASQPARRFGKGRDVAEIAVFLASNKAGYINGQKIDVSACCCTRLTHQILTFISAVTGRWRWHALKRIHK